MTGADSTEYGLLGPLRVSMHGEDIPLSSRMQRKILAVLLVARGRVVSVDRLEFGLWEDSPPRTARKTLRTLISRLRSAVGADAIATHPEGYSIRGTTDAERFEDGLERARTLLTVDSHESRRLLETSLALWRGQALGEFRDEEFARTEAQRLEELRLAATEELFEAQLAVADAASAVPALQTFVRQQPYRERPHGQLMRALYMTGRTPEALAVYASFRQVCRDDLGIDPSPELRELELQILQQDDGLRASPVAATDTPAAGDTALPAAPNRLVGRADELESLAEAVEGARIVTVVGPPGVGKTRLAMEFGRYRAPRFSDGARWIELADVDGCCRVDESIAAALRLRTQSGQSATHTLADALAGREMLLILDNCEQAVEEIATLTELLAKRHEGLHVLATSREPLGIIGEHLVPLEPLSVTPQLGAGPAPALELFGERAAAVLPGFELTVENVPVVTEICRRLDGLPLAIELVVADLRAFNLSEIATRLEQRLIGATPRTGHTRHRTLDAAVDWSYSQLNPAEQLLFERLSLFPGGCDLAAARSIVPESTAAEVAHLVQRLVEHSLVAVDRTHATTRYHLLETLRSFGLRRLAEQGRLDEAADRQAAWAIELAEDLHRQMKTPEEGEAVARFDLELINLRAAHTHVIRAHDVDGALRLAVALYPYTLYRLRDEPAEWAEAALQLAGAATHPLYPAACGAAASVLAVRFDIARAQEIAAAGLAAAHDQRSVLYPLDALSIVALESGDAAAARRYAERTIGAAVQVGDHYHEALAHLTKFVAEFYSGDEDAGAASVERLADLAQTVRSPTLLAWASSARAELLHHRDPTEALVLLDDAIARAEAVGNELIVGLALRTTADIHAAGGDVEPAVRAFQRIITHWHVRGDWSHQLGTLWRLVALLERLNRPSEAAMLLGAVRAEHDGTSAVDFAPGDMDEATERLRGLLGSSAFARQLRRGQSMDRSQTVALARSILAGERTTGGRQAAGHVPFVTELSGVAQR